jgi:DNA-binding NtrC family response regulator
MMTERHGRVLVVDDEVNIREAIAKILTKQDHALSVASEGTSAMAALREGAFQVVITDLKSGATYGGPASRQGADPASRSSDGLWNRGVAVEAMMAADT